MEELTLTWDQGQVRGQGRDVVGLFTFSGTYQADGRVSLVKQYVGRHAVLYEGAFDGEGAITGRWFVDAAQTGPFALAPARSVGVDNLPIRDLN